MATPKVIPIAVPSQAPAILPQRARSIPSKRGRMAYLTPDETLAVLKAAHEHSRRDWAMILLAYRHGLRASEVCGLRLTDVNLKDGVISIKRLKGSLKTVQPLYAHRGQPLLDEVSAVRSWLKVRPADGSDYLFTSQKGGRLDRTQFFRIFQSVAEAAGLLAEKRHPHVLKHSLASHLVAGNVNLALVKQALGHRSISSTMVYVGTTDAQAAEAVQAALMGVF
ncbi:MAG TPA: tyrosine-type recombinase/integrase [Candidatus Acidoferrum sp.]|nr:tyrosine-type recombinase/integrase [Candidatus Acidoferrum sp.]